MNPKYPYIDVKLIGENADSFFILGTVYNKLKQHNITKLELDKFFKEASSGDYNNLLCTCMRWVNVE